jgi:hypothetical protein
LNPTVVIRGIKQQRLPLSLRLHCPNSFALCLSRSLASLSALLSRLFLAAPSCPLLSRLALLSRRVGSGSERRRRAAVVALSPRRRSSPSTPAARGRQDCRR